MGDEVEEVVFDSEHESEQRAVLGECLDLLAAAFADEGAAFACDLIELRGFLLDHDHVLGDGDVGAVHEFDVEGFSFVEVLRRVRDGPDWHVRGHLSGSRTFLRVRIHSRVAGIRVVRSHPGEVFPAASRNPVQ